MDAATFNESELRATNAQLSRLEYRLSVAKRMNDRLAIQNLQIEIKRVKEWNERALRNFTETV